MRQSSWSSRSRRSRPGRARKVTGALAAGLAAILSCALPAAAASPGWTLEASANPSSTQQSFLDGVACTSGGADCFAVGSSLSSRGVLRTLIEHWNGKSWMVAASPNHRGALVSTLLGVSCAGRTSCFAVGNYRSTPRSPALTLIEHWNGTRWSIVPSPNVRSATGNYLTAVSCTSAVNCIAVGYAVTPYSSSSTFVERWSGSRWSIMRSPNPRGAAISSFAGVSCTAPKVGFSCTAVGNWSKRADGQSFSTLTERWTGGSWNLVGSPNANGKNNSALNAVSCTSARSCLAVGYWQHKPGAPLVEQWNGSSWRLAPSPNPAPGFTFAQLNGVACTGRDCYAVGAFSLDLRGTDRTLITHWNGSKWLVASSPNPANASSGLTSIACPTVRTCRTVGQYQKGAFGGTLAEHRG